MEFLRGYGVRLVLDLRGEEEARERSDRPLGDDVLWRNVTLLDFNAADADDIRRNMQAGDMTPGAAYTTMLANRDGFAAAVRVLLEAPEGSCVLFHCQAGKDRTGVLAMLLLSLAGVDRQDCITNYMQTRENLMRTSWYPAEFARAGEMRDILDSLPETMAYVYDHVQKAYGGAAGFLSSCGVSDAELAELRRRLGA